MAGGAVHLRPLAMRQPARIYRSEDRREIRALDEAVLGELTRLPTIFAYEAARELDPKFGLIREVTVRRGQVRIEYDIIPLDPFLVAADFDALSFELDIGNWEMNRTHWAVKDVNLPKELHTARGIALPSWTA